MSVFCTAYIVKMAATCIGCVYLIFLGFSRAYLGLCFFNQILFGALLGLTLALICHLKVKPLFLAMPEMLYGEHDGSVYKVTPMSFVKSFCLGFILPMLLACSILLMREDRAFHHSNEWNYRQANAGCEVSMLADDSK